MNVAILQESAECLPEQFVPMGYAIGKLLQ
jgi:hypothetical protein